jgi:hypothetical protein
MRLVWDPHVYERQEWGWNKHAETSNDYGGSNRMKRNFPCPSFARILFGVHGSYICWIAPSAYVLFCTEYPQRILGNKPHSYTLFCDSVLNSISLWQIVVLDMFLRNGISLRQNISTVCLIFLKHLCKWIWSFCPIRF